MFSCYGMSPKISGLQKIHSVEVVIESSINCHSLLSREQHGIEWINNKLLLHMVQAKNYFLIFIYMYVCMYVYIYIYIYIVKVNKHNAKQRYSSVVGLHLLIVLTFFLLILNSLLISNFQAEVWTPIWQAVLIQCSLVKMFILDIRNWISTSNNCYF